MSTVEDMLVFGNKLLQGELISKRYVDTMYEQLKLKNGQTRSYGLGVAMWYDSHKRFMFGHIGGGTGFTTQLIIMPKEKIVSIYLINAKDRFADNPAVTFIETILGDTIPQVKKPLSDRLLGIALANGADAALKSYKTIAADSSKYYILGESEILLCGDDLMRVNRQRDAIIIYTYCAEQNPNSLNSFIGLADAYLKDGNKGMALKAFIKAAKIDRNNSYANKMIKKLESQP
jgi:tetratricopeptide (TPR) repeat protein